ncbi:MAG: TIR domain-containing protein, partial [Ruminococcaceae bacterium]|nr:TIR domain-containing protein [Oscillospiraceae bacterium]
MSDFRYDAFISYRHAEKDTLIASEIQKSLERFKIPKALRKKSGKERFNRVFRDVEELPITSNLTEDLEEALKSSEYLIVICSFRTSESTWVKREIEKFLEFHDYNKQLILTVLVEGEPD